MNRYLSAILLLISSTVGFGQANHRINEVLTRGTGVQANVVPYAKVYVCQTGQDCTVNPAYKVSLYKDIGLTIPKDNPVTADANGNFDYYIPAGCVDERYSAPGTPIDPVPNVCIASSSATLAVAAGNNISVTNTGITATVSVVAPGSARQLTMHGATGTALANTNITASSDLNSITAPDQMSADRVNGLWNFDQMADTITNDLTQSGCTTGTCDSISGIATTSQDPRITPNAPRLSYSDDAAGVGGTFNTLLHYRNLDYFGWKIQNPSYSGPAFPNGIFHGEITPFSFNHTQTHAVAANTEFTMGITQNYFFGNDDQNLGFRQNHELLGLAVNSAGGQVGAVIEKHANNLGKGDNVGDSSYLQCYGHNEGDNEGCEFYRLTTVDQTTRWGMTLSATPTLLSGSLYNLHGTLPNNYNADALGVRNGIIDISASAKYSAGNVSTLVQCSMNGTTVCVTGDGSTNWTAAFGTTTFQNCTVSGGTVHAPQDVETGLITNTVVCNVPSTTGFTSGTNVVLAGHNYDMCNITSMVAGTSITLTCKEAHSGVETLATGGMAGYAFHFDIDTFANATDFQNKIGSWPVGLNNGVPFSRQVAPIIGYDGTKIILYTGLWGQLTTMGLPQNTVTSPPALSVQWDGGGTVTGVTVISQTPSAYSLLGASNSGAMPQMLPLPTITFSGGCTAVAKFTGYTFDGNGRYILNTPVTVTTPGTGCTGATATAQTVYPNPYGIYPYAQTYSILSNNGTTWQATGDNITVTLINPNKFAVGHTLDNEIFVHDRIHTGYMNIAKYGTMQGSPQDAGGSNNRNYTGLMGGDVAEGIFNTNNGQIFPSRNNPPAPGKGYATPPNLFRFGGAWKNVFIVNSPYPSGFQNTVSGNINNTRGSLFSIGCDATTGPGLDCNTSQDDYNLFALRGSPAGGSLVNAMYYSPDQHTLYWTDAFHIQSGIGGTAPSLTVDGPSTFGGPMTFTNPLYAPFVTPSQESHNNTWTLSSAANQFNSFVTCTGTGPIMNLPSSPKVGEAWTLSSGTTNGICNVQSSAGIGNAGTLPTIIHFSNGGTIKVHWDGTAWRIDSQSPISGLTASIGGSALTAGTCATGTVTILGAFVGSPAAVSASDGTLPDPLIILRASVTATNTVTVQLCAVSAVTPTAKTYNVRVIN